MPKNSVYEYFKDLAGDDEEEDIKKEIPPETIYPEEHKQEPDQYQFSDDISPELIKKVKTPFTEELHEQSIKKQPAP
jgi:hypothetical protein